METNLKCTNNATAKIVVPKANNHTKEPYVQGKIMVNLSKSDLQDKVTVRCAAEPKVLGSDNPKALVFSHGQLIDIMMPKLDTTKVLTVKIKINSSIVK